MSWMFCICIDDAVFASKLSRCEVVWALIVFNCLNLERTEKLSLTSIKTVVSEEIEGHEEYHLMVNHLFSYLSSS